jgi:hypothetical protein
MAEHDEGDSGWKSPRTANLGNANRFTVALPFSKIALEDSSEGLRDLALLVADLADAVASAVGNDETAEMRRRARELNHRLNG